ncbi:cardiolipin synthase [Spiroplasma endosymbiont of Nebria brevicollis]|uniref:cardiolipin synthase n=1 Tax=Spiroplasma endosymbiont of Nebria brevicollis TaxID=3066284 RepID=UPI00313F2444
MRKRVNLFLSLILYIAFISGFVFLVFNYIAYSWIFLIIIISVTILTGIIIFITNRVENVKLSWIMVTLCLPILGIFLYWTFGRPYRYRKKQKAYLKVNNYFYEQEDWTFSKASLNQENSNLDSDMASLFRYTTRISHRPFYKNTDVQILSNGPKKFNQLFEDLSNAKTYIFINYFIIAEGELLEVMLEILKERITAGIKIYIIYDAVGSYFSLSKYKIWKIKKMGIHFHKFSPVRLPFMTGTYNFRNHRKDIVIDGTIGYAGGINLSDDYIHLSAKYGFWRDTHIRIVGEAVKSIDLIFRQDWHFITGDIIDIAVENPKVKIKNNIIVQVIDDGPVTKETIQKDLFIKFISSAKTRVWINTPYLIPTSDLITALRNSAYSGVDVRLTLPGITDKFLSLDMSRTYYDSLIEAGVEIYEYNSVFNHSKSGIFDENITIIGSTNLDYRSLYSDHQTLVLVYDKKTNNDLGIQFEKDFTHSTLIKINPLMKRSTFYRRVFLPLFRILAPLF